MAEPIVTLEEAKGYLRVDFEDDDALIEELVGTATKLAADAARMTPARLARHARLAKTAVLYATAYLYERRDSADSQKLALSLRALLAGIRRSVF